MTTEPDWQAIRAAYNSGMPQTQICSEFGVTITALNKRMDYYSWPLRRGSIDMARLRKRGVYLIHRAHLLVNEQLTLLEDRLKEESSSLDDRRNMNTLVTLIQLFEKLVKLETQIREEGENATGVEHDDQAERLRSDLEERLKNLHS